MSRISARKRLYWTLQLTGWSLYGVVGIVFFVIYGRLNIYFVGVELLVISTLLLLSHLLRNYIHRHGWLQLSIGRLLPRVLLGTALVSVVCQVIVGTLVTFVLRPPASVGGTANWQQYIGYALQTDFVMWMWCAFYFGLHYLDSYKQADVDKWKLAAAVQEAEMRTLKAQINPHFMFNGLNNIRALVMEDPARARDMITHLSDLLRYSIQLNSAERVPLGRELEIVEHYLQLEALQLEERLTYSLDVDPAALPVLIPPMTLQLLVENAIKHGISPRPAGGFITLTAQPDAGTGQLHVVVRNTGRFEPRPGYEGVGLRNARERLQLLFGASARLRIANDPTGPDTVVATLELPLAAPLPESLLRAAV
ncbi:histidine kinase [Hymenobacter sp. BT175]|uniref:sensor histidine kinase n=1 Tax=Hymenobacter translucens TaxID=2886507 RepID=UPI001D0DEE7C|nr:histidine kinase [Hymenobacter translucens]MCC2548631.1 histidine kinase [Hymenobacter translucens]